MDPGWSDEPDFDDRLGDQPLEHWGELVRQQRSKECPVLLQSLAHTGQPGADMVVGFVGFVGCCGDAGSRSAQG
jgi:hypothetical protein